ncbi:potassium-transporting ATPase subunit C [Sediminibacterium soli]|uniref:potassium-transporting ATPase subunit C n=1 Tax=Sediminibacterium soli TaxID=2698829 RepID=UPI00137B5760|nr:potassium-transporting ATPase subunit C [Sediminibacterium soli]NCI46740.1 potassium-transporting ATPase subunit C [Sediminibacterium soli]
MKQHILPAIKLTLVCVLLFMITYPALIWAVAQAAPAKGEGETVTVNGKTVGYRLEGQMFNNGRYFWSRPSAVGYNAAGSAGSNKGPSNPDYLKEVQARIDTFLAHHPGVSKAQLPSDMVTASGSGLDPDISLQAAGIQAERIAKFRNIAKDKIDALIRHHIEKSINGIERINVLSINIALDQLK